MYCRVAACEVTYNPLVADLLVELGGFFRGSKIFCIANFTASFCVRSLFLIEHKAHFISRSYSELVSEYKFTISIRNSEPRAANCLAPLF
jgi:hypothetical protein